MFYDERDRLSESDEEVTDKAKLWDGQDLHVKWGASRPKRQHSKKRQFTGDDESMPKRKRQRLDE